MNRAQIDECLAGKRVAVVGVSRTGRDFSRMLFRELVKRGYDAVPVNPAATEIEGRRACASIAEVSPPVDWALVMTNTGLHDHVVRECAAAGVRRVWLYGSPGDAVLRACSEQGVEALSGCPYMFLPKPGFPHNFHGLLVRIAGRYPK